LNTWQVISRRRAASFGALPLAPRRLQCFYGEEEEDTLCRDPQLAAAEVIRTKGGHHFDEDYVALARRILDGARRRLAPAPL